MEKSLSIILDDVNIVLPQRDLSNEQKKQFRSIIEGCHNVLNTIREMLEKYQELGSDPKNSIPRASGARSERVEETEVEAGGRGEASKLYQLKYVSVSCLLRRAYYICVHPFTHPYTPGKQFRKSKAAWIGCTSAKMIKRVGSLAIGSRRSIIILSKMTSWGGGKREPAYGY